VSGDIEKAIGTYELWAQAYPRDNVPRSNLGVIYGYLGQYEKAVTEIQAALRLNPDSAVGYTNLVSHYAALNRFEDAKAIFRRATERKLDNPYLHLNLYGVAFVQGDAQEMQRQMDWAAGKVQAEDLLLSGHSDTEAYWGKLKKAREFSQRAAEAALSHEQKETAAEWQMNAALREAEFGNTAQAHAQATFALAASSNRELQILAALVLARTGDSNRAARMADDLAKRFPVDTGVNRYWLPTIRAAIEINHRNPAKAVEVLQAAAPYELGNPLPQAEIGAFLYPVYLRGQCYLQLHQGQEAAAEFQKFLDHQGITLNSPLGALAHLGLARAYASQSDSTKARKAYDEFFALWKDADPDLRILKEAKEEYAKLQ
jgi:tetratricopeptide (TPR) repeat protein